MNGKRAKQLRRLARQMTPNQPERAYSLENNSPKRAEGTWRLKENTTRRVYQQLKR